TSPPGIAGGSWRPFSRCGGFPGCFGAPEGWYDGSEARMTSQWLERSLTNLRKRMLAMGLASALGWAIVVGLLVMVACALIDLLLDLPGTMRRACGYAALASVAALALKVLWQV